LESLSVGPVVAGLLCAPAGSRRREFCFRGSGAGAAQGLSVGVIERRPGGGQKFRHLAVEELDGDGDAL